MKFGAKRVLDAMHLKRIFSKTELRRKKDFTLYPRLTFSSFLFHVSDVKSPVTRYSIVRRDSVFVYGFDLHVLRGYLPSRRKNRKSNPRRGTLHRFSRDPSSMISPRYQRRRCELQRISLLGNCSKTRIQPFAID